MFSGAWNLRKDSVGRIFIDRDGPLFKHILNYLRDGVERIPINMMDAILPEARFYQLHNLISSIETAQKETLLISQAKPTEAFAEEIMVK